MHTMHILPGVAIQPNIELKTRPKQLLGSLPLVITLPDWPKLGNGAYLFVPAVLLPSRAGPPERPHHRVEELLRVIESTFKLAFSMASSS
jgi:hypothetical protein